ncbi:ABC transporter substrate-binding protein [Nonomuraea sp. NPDC050536]|uniref:ABC transporter substrate-binding protein n=1 Tax=Nonomuraea sp. NPDC050536 TaxID=3364366 RepID=UPI0037C85DAA
MGQALGDQPQRGHRPRPPLTTERSAPFATNLFRGRAEPARSMLGSVVFPDGPPQTIAYDYDPARATQLVRASGYDGKPLKLIYGSSYADSVAIAAALQAQWKKIGVNVSLEPMEFGEWLKAVTAPQPHQGYDLSVTTIGSGTISHQLDMMIWTEHFGSGWPTAEVSQAIAKFSAAQTPKQIQHVLVDFEGRLSSELRAVPITYGGYIWVLRDGVGGFSPRTSQYVRLNTVTVP